MKSSDLDVGRIVGEEKDGAVKHVVWIKNLCTREAIPPSLSVTVDYTTVAVDLDIPELSSVISKERRAFQ